MVNKKHGSENYDLNQITTSLYNALENYNDEAFEKTYKSFESKIEAKIDKEIEDKIKKLLNNYLDSFELTIKALDQNNNKLNFPSFEYSERIEETGYIEKPSNYHTTVTFRSSDGDFNLTKSLVSKRKQRSEILKNINGINLDYKVLDGIEYFPQIIKSFVEKYDSNFKLLEESNPFVSDEGKTILTKIKPKVLDLINYMLNYSEDLTSPVHAGVRDYSPIYSWDGTSIQLFDRSLGPRIDFNKLGLAMIQKSKVIKTVNKTSIEFSYAKRTGYDKKDYSMAFDKEDYETSKSFRKDKEIKLLYTIKQTLMTLEDKSSKMFDSYNQEKFNELYKLIDNAKVPAIEEKESLKTFFKKHFYNENKTNFPEGYWGIEKLLFQEIAVDNVKEKNLETIKTQYSEDIKKKVDAKIRDMGFFEFIFGKIKPKDNLKINKLEKLVEKIHEKRNANAARHLIRNLEKAYNSSNLDIEKIYSRKGVLRGIAETIKALSNNHSNFKKKYGGWGFYKTIIDSEFSNPRGLWFTKMKSCVLKGKESGHYAIFNNHSKATGYKSGHYAIFNDYSEATGYKSGHYAIFNRHSKASGKHSGKESIFWGCSEASGKHSGKESIFNINSEASGKHSGKESIFNESKACGRNSGRKSTFNNYSKATGYKSGHYAIFNDRSEAYGRNSGRKSTFNNYSKATGYKSGHYAIFNDHSEAYGRCSGWRSTFNDHSEASGIRSGKKSIFNDNSEACGRDSGWRSTFNNYSKASGISSGKKSIFNDNSILFYNS